MRHRSRATVVPMANPEHFEILMRGRDAWNEWRKKNPATSPDLSGVQFRGRVGQEPPGGDLSFVDLSGANLVGAVLWNLNVHDANLRNIAAHHADFRSSTFGVRTLVRRI